MTIFSKRNRYGFVFRRLALATALIRTLSMGVPLVQVILLPSGIAIDQADDIASTRLVFSGAVGIQEDGQVALTLGVRDDVDDDFQDVGPVPG
ncbi:hypothetical protein WP1_253 [Pseudomonas phage WP1]